MKPNQELNAHDRFVKQQATDHYISLQLPAQVQLAEKMRRRGLRVDAGSRIEYVVTDMGGLKAKQFQKLEDPEYQKKHSSIIRIDYLYYIKNAINPLDQALSVAFKMEKFTEKQHKLMCQKYKYLRQIEDCIDLNYYLMVLMILFKKNQLHAKLLNQPKNKQKLQQYLN